MTLLLDIPYGLAIYLAVLGGALLAQLVYNFIWVAILDLSNRDIKGVFLPIFISCTLFTLIAISYPYHQKYSFFISPHLPYLTGDYKLALVLAEGFAYWTLLSVLITRFISRKRKKKEVVE